MNTELFSDDREDKKNKKVYPSQLNTKTVSARIPVSDYVNFLEDAMRNGISLNDWLLVKIYGNDKSKNVIRISKDFLEKYNAETLEFWKREFIGDSIDIDFDFSLSLLDMVCRKQNLIDYYANVQSSRVASLTDVKAQLAILIKEKFESSKDQISYRRELFKILRELE